MGWIVGAGSLESRCWVVDLEIFGQGKAEGVSEPQSEVSRLLWYQLSDIIFERLKVHTRQGYFACGLADPARRVGPCEAEILEVAPSCMKKRHIQNREIPASAPSFHHDRWCCPSHEFIARRPPTAHDATGFFRQCLT